MKKLAMVLFIVLGLLASGSITEHAGNGYDYPDPIESGPLV